MIQNKEHAKSPGYSESEIKKAVNEIEAPISEELLRMYIAYARMYIYPVASEDVIKEITRFYLDVRNMKGNKPDSPVPITPRSIEDLQRLSEAHARMRLSNQITFDDVKAAKRLMIVSLKQVGMDENGQLDAGISYIGRSKSQMEKTDLLFGCIRDYCHDEDIIKEMKAHGVDEETTIGYIKRFLKDGKIYRVKPGELRSVQY